MINVLLIGPVPKPTTGVSLANQVVIDYLDKKDGFSTNYINTSFNRFDENLGSFSISKLLFYLKLNVLSYKIFYSDMVYITPGQTFYGVLKYAFFIFFTKLLRKELVVHIHGNHVCKEYATLEGSKKQLYKKILSKTDKGIVLSEMLIGNMTPFLSKEKIFILYNFVEDYLFCNENRIDLKLKVKEPKIIFLSNLMEEKGIFELLEALKLLEKEGFQYEAKIAGNIDSKNKKRVEAYFKSLVNVTYCGVVSGEEKKALLLWGNIFVLPTYYVMEGQPISILEAMATANLILTTNHAGIPNIFTNNINGYYIQKQSIESIATQIKIATLNYESSNSIRKHNFKTANEKYRVENFINNIEIIFRE